MAEPSTKRRRKQVFSSVFSASSSTPTVPTPQVTPVQSFVTPEQSFARPLPAQISFESPKYASIADERIAWNQAWHTATSLLILPRESIQPDHSWQIKGHSLSKLSRDLTTVETRALELVLGTNFQEDGPSKATEGRDLVEWYTNEVRMHFLNFTKPQIISILASTKRPETAVRGVLLTLKCAQNIYELHLTKYVVATLEHLEDGQLPAGVVPRTKLILPTFLRNLHALVAYSVPQEAFSAVLKEMLMGECRLISGVPDEILPGDDGVDQPPDDDLKDVVMADDEFGQGRQPRHPRMSWAASTEARELEAEGWSDPDTPEMRASRLKVLNLYGRLEDVGLGGPWGQRVFAEVIDAIMTEFIKHSFTAQWSSPSKVPNSLRDWVEGSLARLIVDVLYVTKNAENQFRVGSARKEDGTRVEVLMDVERWIEVGVGRLGRLRVEQLFDIVVEWGTSKGAVEDLKTYITLPYRRSHLTTSFVRVLLQRLLQPGASTIEILQVYISLIRSFSLLDPKGVLLDRVARPIRRYLKDREDTVRVIVVGLLADIDGEDGDPASNGDVLVELAVELNRPSTLAGQRPDDDGELDWDDMNWAPDPIDAGPDYKKSKGSDVVGSLISLFESKDVFVREFQNIMGERLLKKAFDLEKEIRVLELLKLRFGEGALQVCEVMLRDIRESKGIDRNIRTDQSLHIPVTSITTAATAAAVATIPHDSDADADAGSEPGRHVPNLHAKIVSRLFWPDLHDDTFALPPPISSLQTRYEAGFEKLKQSRKLTWLPALGQATVELDLQDRVVTEECHTWQAAVIYAFQPSSPPTSPSHEPEPETRSVADLVAELDMPEDLVRNALTFWVAKLVLRPVADEPDVYAVLERLPRHETSDAQTAAAAHTHTHQQQQGLSAAIRDPGSERSEKFSLYRPFVVGMLTNGGAMALGQIVGMLRMVGVPGGAAFAEEELGGWLDGLVEGGELGWDVGAGGGKYRIL